MANGIITLGAKPIDVTSIEMNVGIRVISDKRDSRACTTNATSDTIVLTIDVNKLII